MESQPEIDPENPYAPVHTGLLELFVEVNEQQRPYGVYIPINAQSPVKGLYIFIPAGMSIQYAMVQYNIADIAQKYGIIVILLSAGKQWERGDMKEDVSYARMVYADTHRHAYFALGVAHGTEYVMGLEDGAMPAAVFALIFDRTIAAFAAMGDCVLDRELLEAFSEIDHGNKDLYGGKVPLSAWIIDRQMDRHPLIDYCLGLAYIPSRPLLDGNTRVWLAQPKGKLNHPEMEIRYTPMGESMPTVDEVIEFLVGFRRTMKESGYLQRIHSAEELGLCRWECVFEGRKRHWHIYCPAKCKKGTGYKYPLVLALHGYTGTGDSFAEESDWNAVADRCGFIVAYPTAYPYARTDEGLCKCPVPAWNCGIYPRADNLNDVAFIKEMLRIIKDNYPVDEKRFFVTGHSNGSRMTQKLMREFPVFAAYAPSGATETGTDGKPFCIPTPGVRPVWCFMGEYDYGDAARMDEDSETYKTIQYFCEVNGGDFRNGSWYDSLPYHNFVAYDRNHVPVVRFTEIKGQPHTYTPEMSWMIWNEFFSHFHRENGISVYSG